MRVCVYVREREREEVGAGEGKRGSFKCLLKPDIVGPDRAYLGPAVRGLHCVSMGNPKAEFPDSGNVPGRGLQCLARGRHLIFVGWLKGWRDK